MALVNVDRQLLQGVSNPITQQAQVQINAVFDRRTFMTRSRTETPGDRIVYGGRDSSSFSAHRHELAFMKPTPTKNMNGVSHMASTQNDVGILTCFNGLRLEDLSSADAKRARTLYEHYQKTSDKNALEQLYRYLRSLVKFVGVNLTTIDAGNSNRADTMAIQVAGMITVINTGPDRLGIMERVCWDVPRLDIDKQHGHGLPNGKRPALIVSHAAAVRRNIEDAPARMLSALNPQSQDEPYVETEKIIAEVLVDLAGEMSGVDKRTLTQNLIQKLQTKAFQEKMHTFLKAAHYLSADADDRVIGTSATAAFPGSQCDLLLRHVM